MNAVRQDSPADAVEFGRWASKLCLTAKAFVAIRAPRIAARALNRSNGSERRCVSATTHNKGLDQSGCAKRRQKER
jgi:hypothetical protein